MAVEALFFDLGGVVLSNGWDRDQRRKVVQEFGVDWDDFSERHDLVAAAFETGRMTLGEYLRRTVFHVERSFGPDQFWEAMVAQSTAHAEVVAFLAELKATGRYLLATLNNESRELNRYRIEAFGLRNHFDVFICSAFVGIKKPDARIYRLALDLTQKAAESVVFVDDRSVNLECAGDEGMRTVHYAGLPSLQSELETAGVRW